MRQKISIGGRKNQIVISKQLRIWKKFEMHFKGGKIS